MTRLMCRESPGRRRERVAWEELVRHIKMVSDPEKLAQLNAELERRKRKQKANSATCCGHLTRRQEED
jgi:hypothetical protein